MKRFLRIVPYVILIAALALLLRELMSLRWSDIARSLEGYTWDRYAYALALLALNYFVWSGYDWVSLRQLEIHVPYVQIFRTCAVAFPITNLVGYSLITGFAIRVKKYSPYGVSLSRITQLILFNVESWWAGFLFMCGAALIHSPLRTKFFGLGMSATRLAGIGILATVLLYLILCARAEGKVIRVMKANVHLPDLLSGHMKVLVGLVDNVIVALTLYIFLPQVQDISFAKFLAYFSAANLVAIVSLVPGGLGVMEGAVLLLFRRYATSAELLTAMVMFRIFHFLIPVAIALALETCPGPVKFFKQRCVST